MTILVVNKTSEGKIKYKADTTKVKSCFTQDIKKAYHFDTEEKAQKTADFYAARGFKNAKVEIIL